MRSWAVCKESPSAAFAMRRASRAAVRCPAGQIAPSNRSTSHRKHSSSVQAPPGFGRLLLELQLSRAAPLLLQKGIAPSEGGRGRRTDARQQPAGRAGEESAAAQAVGRWGRCCSTATSRRLWARRWAHLGLQKRRGGWLASSVALRLRGPALPVLRVPRRHTVFGPLCQADLGPLCHPDCPPHACLSPR